MVFARLNLTDYANKVINVIKARFELKDKSEAVNKFVELYGDEVVERDANDKYVQKILDAIEKHRSKYKDRRMTLQELDKLCGIDV
ncbi:DUF2683 family protein [Candidatus Woesearchaeota archaeon]|nr:DUF2683 family protein [Candidatus Woesearchaeota archaeon]